MNELITAANELNKKLTNQTKNSFFSIENLLLGNKNKSLINDKTKREASHDEADSSDDKEEVESKKSKISRSVALEDQEKNNSIDQSEDEISCSNQDKDEHVNSDDKTNFKATTTNSNGQQSSSSSSTCSSLSMSSSSSPSIPKQPFAGSKDWAALFSGNNPHQLSLNPAFMSKFANPASLFGRNPFGLQPHSNESIPPMPPHFPPGSFSNPAMNNPLFHFSQFHQNNNQQQQLHHNHNQQSNNNSNFSQFHLNGSGIHHPHGILVKPKKKRSRAAFSHAQVLELEKKFNYQRYLSGPERADLASALKVIILFLNFWFYKNGVFIV
jgi:hypothetical protein